MSLFETKDDRNKKRIGFELGTETLNQIDDLVKRTGADNRAELFRNSLRLYSWWLDKQDEGNEIVLRKDGVDTTVELKQ